MIATLRSNEDALRQEVMRAAERIEELEDLNKLFQEDLDSYGPHEVEARRGMPPA